MPTFITYGPIHKELFFQEMDVRALPELVSFAGKSCFLLEEHVS